MTLQKAETIAPEQLTLGQIAVRMANEGIPIRAICRATKIESEDLRVILDEAISQGSILTIPSEDWPPQTTRENRPQQVVALSSFTNELLDIYLGHVFKVTRLEACVLLPLIKRPEVSREGLHQAIEDRRPTANDETDTKMVDVVICKLRKKLSLHNIKINTNWSRGYSVSADDRKRAADMILAYAATDG